MRGRLTGGPGWGGMRACYQTQKCREIVKAMVGENHYMILHPRNDADSILKVRCHLAYLKQHFIESFVVRKMASVFENAVSVIAWMKNHVMIFTDHGFYNLSTLLS